MSEGSRYPRSSDVYPGVECASLPWSQGHDIAIIVSANPTSLRDTQSGAVCREIEERMPIESLIAHDAHVEVWMKLFDVLALFRSREMFLVETRQDSNHLCKARASRLRLTSLVILMTLLFDFSCLFKMALYFHRNQPQEETCKMTRSGPRTHQAGLRPHFMPRNYAGQGMGLCRQGSGEAWEIGGQCLCSISVAITKERSCCRYCL